MASNIDSGYILVPSFNCASNEYNSIEVVLDLFRIRFFQIFGVEVKKELDLKEGIYLVSIVLFGILMETLNISLQTIISLNGAIIMVLLDIIFPMWIHYRCVLIDRHSGQI